jgi:hypothetical protein
MVSQMIQQCGQKLFRRRQIADVESKRKRCVAQRIA